jgi:hypothetical protein
VAIRFAGTDAVNLLLLTSVVASWVPFQRTTAPDWNPLPFTVSVNAGPPAVAVVGAILPIVGPLAIVKLTAFVVSVLDSTVTWAVPGAAIRFANTGAVTWVSLITLVASAAPFHCTAVPVVNPVPFTVSVKAGPPAVALLGLSELIVGVTLKFTRLEITPPEATVIWAVPANRSRFGVAAAVSWFAFTTVVASGVPFHCTVAPEAKSLPFTVSVKAGPPAAALVGLTLLIVGAASTAKGTAFDATPVVAAVIWAVPGVVSRLAGTAALSWFALTKLVVRPDAFHRTVDPELKFVPFTVKVKPGAVAVAELGVMLVIVGTGAAGGLMTPA